MGVWKLSALRPERKNDAREFIPLVLYDKMRERVETTICVLKHPSEGVIPVT